jgi:hypothetical protein
VAAAIRTSSSKARRIGSIFVSALARPSLAPANLFSRRALGYLEGQRALAESDAKSEKALTRLPLS